MRRFCAGLLVTAFAAMSATPLMAGSVHVGDPLLGYFPGSADNGTNTPTTENPITNFGFTVSPGPQTGDFLLKVLVPNNEDANPPALSFHVTGTSTGIATLVSPTAWTSGTLAGYLGITASPNNPIGAYLPSTQALDPGATGFFVYEADLGTTTLQDASMPNVSPLLNITESVPLASYLVGFLNTGTAANPNFIATANSGAIFETKPPPVIPEPSTIIGATIAVAGAVLYRVRRRKSTTA
jgi:hypothetical protein